MKRILALLLCLATLVCFAACAKKAEPAPAAQTPADTTPTDSTTPGTTPAEKSGDLSAFATLADVFAVASEEKFMSNLTDRNCVCVFLNQEGLALRVVADVTEEIFESVQALDIFDDDYDEQRRALLAPSTVKSVENLSEKLPTDAELAAFVGKKISDLTAAGYEASGYSISDEATVLTVENGLAEYNVELDGLIEESVYNADDFVTDTLLEVAKDFPILDMSFASFAFAALIPEAH